MCLSMAVMAPRRSTLWDIASAATRASKAC
jgi:hypothetical protein